jgi:hypothetical protein
MTLAERIQSELRSHPPGTPLAVEALAGRLQCTLDEVLAVGEELQQREPGDEELISVVKKIDDDGAAEFYLTQLPLTLNDEPHID